MAPYARPVVSDISSHTRVIHLLVDPQDLDRQAAACGTSPFPGRWTDPPEASRLWCRTCALKLKERRK